MKKDEMIARLNAVMKTLDTGITVRGVENAGNLSGCFMKAINPKTATE